MKLLYLLYPNLGDPDMFFFLNTTKNKKVKKKKKQNISIIPRYRIRAKTVSEGFACLMLDIMRATAKCKF